ncbi:NAD(P)-dependent alcohol dehydrogenase [Cytophagales bacterium LB-30]|uniref:NAD(P)-dependent alcohol dehydrogenase n=1 Tax=Shiella aurantiaca TaxID=3058365 RepID=A0ABT8F265_9BACT|nr:NAD(P)-dependent alcohol dehydrogenase [Shiella aurantiaca]MDN4164495.1 NAD(P)-dependent alcohol dehydrogenase [Shiella aurantiaca]
MISSVMKASLYSQYGPPSVLRLEDLPVPVPSDSEILVHVHATTVNRTDCAMLRAKPWIMRLFTGLLRPQKPILGTDFAGIVVGMGNSVTGFGLGDKVFGFDDSGLSSHAQFLSISVNKAIGHIPEGVSFEHAAASLEGVHYAFNFMNKVNLTKGQKMLVNGATGAIGSALVQLLMNKGLQVSAVGNTKNIDVLKKMGVEKVIDYTAEDFTQLNETFDYIFDAVGKSTFARCKHLLSKNGVYISSELGPLMQNPFLALLTSFSKGRRVIFPVPTRPKETLQMTQKELQTRVFTPLIDRVYTYNEIDKAFAYVETGEKSGNVLIDWAEAPSG